MAKVNPRGSNDFGEIELSPVLDTGYAYKERQRKGFVQSDADLPYGAISGFLMKPEHTGMRHKQSSLGRKVRKG